jgi:hypothetical protein
MMLLQQELLLLLLLLLLQVVEVREMLPSPLLIHRVLAPDMARVRIVHQVIPDGGKEGGMEVREIW